MSRKQTQPGNFSRERNELENEVRIGATRSGHELGGGGGGLHFVVKDVLLHLTVLSGPLFLSFSRLCCLSCFNSFLDSCAFLWRKDTYNSQSTTVKDLNPGESILWFE